MGVKTDTYNVILDRFDGWYTAHDSDKIPDGKSPDLLNVRITGSNMRGAKGYSLNGDRNATTGKITAKYTYNRNDGQQRMVQIRDNNTNGTLEWFDAVNGKYYTLLTGLTTGKLMDFVEFNTSTANNMVFCNGVDNLSTWTGSTTRLTSSVTATDTTINVVSTADFPATGTIIYNGTEIAYSGKSATTFTVASAHASAGADDGVAQAVDDTTYSGVTKGNILLSAKDRLWIAGQPGAPSAFDYSDEGDFATYTGGSNRSDSGTEDVFNIGGKITGLEEKGEEIVVLGPDGAVGFSFAYPTSTTKAPLYREIFRSPGQGCASPRSVFKVNNEVYFANKNGIASVTDLEGTEKVFTKSITRDILPTLRNYVFDEAASIFFDKESILLVACKESADSSANDTVIGLEFYRTPGGEETFGITRFDWPVAEFAILADELYFGSPYEPNSFKGFDSYQNDGAPRNIRYATKRFNFKDPFQNKACRLACVRGFIKGGTDIDVNILYNNGFKGSDNKTISSDGAYVSSAVLNTIGAFAMGTNPLGATIDEVGELNEFTVFLDLGVDYEWYDLGFVFSSETDGGTFMITHVGLAVDMSGYANEDQLTI
jgi:uncharacterized protein YrzB (UPF0473 family)